MPSINRSNSRAEQKTLSLARTLLAPIASALISLVAQAAPVTALTWSPVDPSVGRNTTSMVTAYPGADAKSIARQLNGRPAGRRALLLLGFTERLGTDAKDACQVPNGKGGYTLTTWAGPWTSNGALAVQSLVVPFFDALKREGAMIDLLALDEESDFSAGRYIRDDYANMMAIKADRRFPAIAKRLGFSNLKLVMWGTKEYFRWNEVLQADFDGALDRVVSAPFRARWKSASVCNYRSAPIASKFMTPDCSGHGLVRGGTGVGTHNSIEFYGLALRWMDGARFSGAVLSSSAYGMFSQNLHRMRAVRASSPKSLMPWIASYGLGTRATDCMSDFPSPISGTPYWDETVLQLAMHGCDTILVYNPHAWRPEQIAANCNPVSDQVRLANLIDTINAKLGTAPGVSRWFSLPGLQDRVMATGRRVAGGTMWRFSFAEGVASVTVAMKNGDVREIVPEAGEVGAWLFEADNNRFAAKVDGTDIAYAEAPAGAAWPDLDDSGELDQGDISLLLLDMNEMGSPFDINGDNIVTNADVTAFKTIQKSWYAQATKGRTAMEGSVLVTAAR
jgi:hypothetical protein